MLLRKRRRATPKKTKQLASKTGEARAMNKELNIGLLPCPFCGGRNLRVQIERRDVPADAMGQGMSARTVYHEAIWCDVCGVFPHGREWWNRRTGDQK